MLDRMIGFFSNDMAIDLGTANIIVSLKDKGIVINEPSVVSIQVDKMGRKKILAVGREAKEMVGKTPEGITAIRPMREGVIADFDVTERMIRHFIEKVHNRRAFLRPRIVVSVPYGLTQVERKAVRESAMSAGARDVFLIDEPMAAAIGAGLPVKEPQGNMVVNMGGGTTEIGVISLGGLVVSKSIRVAGDKFDTAIVDYVKKRYNLVIGERVGERIKIEIGGAIRVDEDRTMSVNGRDQISGLLITVELQSEEVREALKDPLKDILDAVKSVLEVMPPDLAGDIVREGIVLTGGGALLRGLDKFFADSLKIPVYVAEEPLLAVARGTAKILTELDLLHQLAYDK
jgi:rod shape-determining protein MreB